MIISNRNLLSLSSLCLSEGADPALRAGTHLRWHLTTDLGFPHAGFRVRARRAPDWPWLSDVEDAWFDQPRIATSVAGVHVRDRPLRAENAELTAEHHLRCSSRSTPINFVYEQRERTDPVFQPWVRFAVLLDAGGRTSSSMVRLKGFATRNGVRVEVAEMSGRFNTLLSAPGPKAYPGLFIGHGEMDLVTFQAPDDISVVGVLYATANFFDGLSGWNTLAVLEPLTAADTEAVVAPADPKALARVRLRNMRPIRRVTEPGTGGRGSNVPNHNDFDERLSAQAPRWAEMMKAAFGREINGRHPPGTITIDDLDDTDTTGDHPDIEHSKLSIPFYGLLQAASFEPHIAAMLGLGYFDVGGKVGKWDYAVDAVVSTVWLRYSQYSVAARDQYDLQTLPPSVIAHGQGSRVWTGLPRQLQPYFQRLASFVVDVAAARPDPIPPPTLHAIQFPDATLSPVQARVELTVAGIAPGVRPLFWRAKRHATEQVELDLSPKDEASGQLLAANPDAEGKVSVYDGRLLRYGTTPYGAVNIDGFGRASKVTIASTNVRDLVPPPAPGVPEVTLGQTDAQEDSLFRASRVSFLWSNGAADAASDVVVFNLLWKAGFHSPEEVLSQPDGQRALAWPPAPGQETIPDPDVGTRLIETLDLPTSRQGHRREVTVVCTARDRAGNVSAPSPPGQGIRIDEIKVLAPVQPEEPQWSSWPDAKGEVRWRCRWEVTDDVQASRLLTASETRILSLSGADRAAHFALSPAARAAALKTLASTTPNAFVPSELALPTPIDHADVVMKAGVQDWRVAVIEFIGATGQKADWPDQNHAFAVIRPRGLELLPPPVLRINVENGVAKINAEADTTGQVDIFTVAHPNLVEAATALGPVATVVVPGEADEDLASVALAEWQSDWIGFAAWLWAEDGRRSELSPILWRQAV
jgi:hypothetical protein